MIEIVPAYTEERLDDAIKLSQEYVSWMVATIRERLPELDVSQFTVEHSYDDVRKKFPGDHVPPYGRLYIALSDGQVAGCIALGKLSEEACEMRTLYVRPTFRGAGIAKKLIATVLDDAHEIGYQAMRLDTLPFMESALGLYRSLGFHDRAPYGDIPTSLSQYICYMEKDLR